MYTWTLLCSTKDEKELEELINLNNLAIKDKRYAPTKHKSYLRLRCKEVSKYPSCNIQAKVELNHSNNQIQLFIRDGQHSFQHNHTQKYSKKQNPHSLFPLAVEQPTSLDESQSSIDQGGESLKLLSNANPEFEITNGLNDKNNDLLASDFLQCNKKKFAAYLKKHIISFIQQETTFSDNLQLEGVLLINVDNDVNDPIILKFTSADEIEEKTNKSHPNFQNIPENLGANTKDSSSKSFKKREETDEKLLKFERLNGKKSFIASEYSNEEVNTSLKFEQPCTVPDIKASNAMNGEHLSPTDSLINFNNFSGSKYEDKSLIELNDATNELESRGNRLIIR